MEPRFLLVSGEDVILGNLKKTGQTTQYSGKEDDGYWEKGLSPNLQILTTGEYSGTTDITINGKTHTISNNCVVDHNTNLMWVRYFPNGDIGPDSNGKLKWVDAVNSEDIFELAAQANAQRLGGHADWRVPNARELLSLLNFSGTPMIDNTAFPGDTGAEVFFSGTTAYDNDANAVWVSNFILATYGVLNVCAKSDKQLCRLVRGN